MRATLIARILPWLDRLVALAILLLPIVLTHGRAVAEILVALIAAAFLLRSVLLRDWAWARRGWVPFAFAWWGWLVACSITRTGPMALLLIRVPLFLAGLEWWVLRDAALRRWVVRMIQLAAAYIVAQEALQWLSGYNLFGFPRRPSGELTGPYEEARAGPVLSRLILPALLPALAAGRQGGAAARLGSGLLLLIGLAAVLLFGQRMPAMLVGLGLLVCGALLPRLRPLLAIAGLASLGLVAVSAVIDPPTFQRLVLLFASQMRDWPDTQYGQLAARAASIVLAHPVTGQGWDSFRTVCLDRQYWHGWPQILHGVTGFHPRPQPPMTDLNAVWTWLRELGGGVTVCSQHPHNHYLQAAVEAGLPGLALFCAMVFAWLRACGRGLWRDPRPLRVGLFAAVLIQEWPIASSSNFVNMPLGGWFLLLLGLGLAEARWSAPAGD